MVHPHVPLDCRDDAVRHRTPELYSQGVADGVDPVPHRQAVGGAELGGRQVPGVNFQHRQVAVGVAAHVFGVVELPGVQDHLAVLPALQNVAVRDDIPVLGKDDPGAHGGAVPQLGQHQHHRGIHLLVDLLGGQGLVMSAQNLHGAAHAGGGAGNRDLLRLPVPLFLLKGDGKLGHAGVPGPFHDQGDARQKRQDQKARHKTQDSLPPPAAQSPGLQLPLPRLGTFPARRGREGRQRRQGLPLGPHPLRKGTAVEEDPLPGPCLPPGLAVDLHHLPGRPLSGLGSAWESRFRRRLPGPGRAGGRGRWGNAGKARDFPGLADFRVELVSLFHSLTPYATQRRRW